MPPSIPLQKRILELLAKAPPAGLRKCDLRRPLGLGGDPDALRRFRQAFADLEGTGAVRRVGGGRYTLAAAGPCITGQLSLHPRGFGFVEREDGEPDIFIPPAGLNTALSGDLVEVQLGDAGPRGVAGRIRRVVRRGRDALVGEYVVQGEDRFIRPLRKDFPEFIPLAQAEAGATPPAPAHGDWIVARLIHPDTPHRPLRAEILRRLSAGQTLTDTLDAVAAEYGLPPPYPPEANLAAASLTPQPIPREDCTALTVVTIDPFDAKDFDDALSIEDGADGTVTVGVHIADVAAYVPAGSDLDAEASRRGFTAYLPGRTLPMLPEALAAVTCSLREARPTLAHSVFLSLSAADGEVLAARRAHTVVRVTQRLTFEEVADAIGGNAPSHWHDRIRDTVHRLYGLCRLMRARRARHEQFLDLSTTEVRVVCRESPPEIVELRPSPPSPAHELVEEFMLAANVAVAEELARRHTPAVYRIHRPPHARDLEEFREWTRAALGLAPGHLRSRSAVNRFLHTVGGSAAACIVHYAFLRTLPRAGYAAAPGEHFGLGKTCYAHFTSPIRRYPDLTVHQQLWRADTGQAALSPQECGARAESATDQERTTDEAYYAASDRLKLRYLREREEAGQGQLYEGVVARLLPEGLLVALPEVGLYGLMPKRLLGAEEFHFNAVRHQLRGRGSGRVYRCGHTVFCRVAEADVVKGVLLLRPARPRLA
ncbi:MAG: Ribonuclease R [Lentisphaerae bacterium ADurb.BinA184]|nr:MAG: Ribonuclease R [Lentisphaerae bacterium ADurb.BinA184]